MEANKFSIKIESILGGHAATTHFASADQFRSSLGINPALPIKDGIGTNGNALGIIASGLLRPMSAIENTPNTLNNSPLWFVKTPKNYGAFVYDAGGSVYTVDSVGNLSTSSATGAGDLTDGGTASGNGAEYYDNYVYFARDTTIARFGPINGISGTYTDDYWVGTLGKTALSNTTYPAIYGAAGASLRLPNHVMHRHSDGRLYFADVVDNQGTIHYIATKKTTIEGDTDNGSTYGKLTFGYGLYPVAIESYGSQLAIALVETSNSVSNNLKAKIAFWDTTSQNANQITWVEFPDEYISAIKNVNGVLYIFSGKAGPQPSPGFRVSRYVGGYSFEEVGYFETGAPPLAGAVDGGANYLVFGSHTKIPETAACVYALGLQKTALGRNLFNIARVTSSSAQFVSSLFLPAEQLFNFNTPVIGWTTGASGVANNGVDGRTNSTANNNVPVYNNAPSVWWSKVYRIGRPGKITGIRIPLAQPLTGNMTVTPIIYFDSGAGSKTLTAITSANYGLNTQSIFIRPENLTFDNDFFLQLKWTGSELCVVGLPITIEYELLDIETAYP